MNFGPGWLRKERPSSGSSLTNGASKENIYTHLAAAPTAAGAAGAAAARSAPAPRSADPNPLGHNNPKPLPLRSKFKYTREALLYLFDKSRAAAAATPAYEMGPEDTNGRGYPFVRIGDDGPAAADDQLPTVLSQPLGLQVMTLDEKRLFAARTVQNRHLLQRQQGYDRERQVNTSNLREARSNASSDRRGVYDANGEPSEAPSDTAVSSAISADDSMASAQSPFRANEPVSASVPESHGYRPFPGPASSEGPGGAMGAFGRAGGSMVGVGEPVGKLDRIQQMRLGASGGLPDGAHSAGSAGVPHVPRLPDAAGGVSAIGPPSNMAGGLGLRAPGEAQAMGGGLGAFGSAPGGMSSFFDPFTSSIGGIPGLGMNQGPGSLHHPAGMAPSSAPPPAVAASLAPQQLMQAFAANTGLHQQPHAIPGAPTDPLQALIASLGIDLGRLQFQDKNELDAFVALIQAGLQSGLGGAAAEAPVVSQAQQPAPPVGARRHDEDLMSRQGAQAQQLFLLQQQQLLAEQQRQQQAFGAQQHAQQPEAAQPAPLPRLALPNPDIKWLYVDPSGNVQGPFTPLVMHEWYRDGYFASDLPIKRSSDAAFMPLAQLEEALGTEQPFLEDMEQQRQLLINTTSLAGDGRGIAGLPSAIRELYVATDSPVHLAFSQGLMSASTMGAPTPFHGAMDSLGAAGSVGLREAEPESVPDIPAVEAEPESVEVSPATTSPRPPAVSSDTPVVSVVDKQSPTKRTTSRETTPSSKKAHAKELPAQNGKEGKEKEGAKRNKAEKSGKAGDAKAAAQSNSSSVAPNGGRRAENAEKRKGGKGAGATDGGRASANTKGRAGATSNSETDPGATPSNRKGQSQTSPTAAPPQGATPATNPWNIKATGDMKKPSLAEVQAAEEEKRNARRQNESRDRAKQRSLAGDGANVNAPAPVATLALNAGSGGSPMSPWGSPVSASENGPAVSNNAPSAGATLRGKSLAEIIQEEEEALRRKDAERNAQRAVELASRRSTSSDISGNGSNSSAASEGGVRATGVSAGPTMASRGGSSGVGPRGYAGIVASGVRSAGGAWGLPRGGSSTSLASSSSATSSSASVPAAAEAGRATAGWTVVGGAKTAPAASARSGFPATSATEPVSESAAPSTEGLNPHRVAFVQWCRSTLRSSEKLGVNVEDFLGILATIPAGDLGMITAICDDTLGGLTSIDPRKFAREFVHRQSEMNKALRESGSAGRASTAGKTGRKAASSPNTMSAFDTGNKFSAVNGAGSSSSRRGKKRN